MNRLKKIRIKKGFSQLELARRAGVSQPSIYLIENYIVKRPRIETVTRLAGALGVDPSDILDENNKS